MTTTDGRRARLGLPPVAKAGAALFVVLAAFTALLVFRSSASVDQTSRAHAAGLQVVTILADVHREVLSVKEAVLVTGTLEADEVALASGLLGRQLGVLTATVSDPALGRTAFLTDLAPLNEGYGRLNALREGPGAGTEQAASQAMAVLEDLDVRAKRLLSAEQVAYFDVFEAIQAEVEQTRLALFATALVTILVGLAVAGTVTARYRRAYGAAYRAAADRQRELESLTARLSASLAEIEEANHALRLADQAKSDFVSTVSHELRTPLTAIRGFSQTLIERWDAFEDGQRIHLIEGIERQGRRQQRLVDDLLIVSRMMAGTLTALPEPVSVARAVETAVEAMQVEGVVVSVPDELHVHVDPDHFAQVLTNLVTNAAKYGAPPIEVTGFDVDDMAMIIVRDHGDGVDAGFVPRLFDKFEQASTGDRRTAAGLGLGLSITRDLVELNGGSIRYEDAPGGGGLFRCTLPAAQVAELAVAVEDEGVASA